MSGSIKKILFNPGKHGFTSSLGLLVLRIGLGSIMLFGYGLGKVSRSFSDDPQFADPIGIGAMPSLYLTAFAELVCAGAIVIGLMTRLAAIPLVIAMLVAAFIVHGADPWLRAHADNGSKELALIFLTGFTAILLTGPGRYSVDGFLVNRKSKPKSS